MEQLLNRSYIDIYIYILTSLEKTIRERKMFPNSVNSKFFLIFNGLFLILFSAVYVSTISFTGVYSLIGNLPQGYKAPKFASWSRNWSFKALRFWFSQTSGQRRTQRVLHLQSLLSRSWTNLWCYWLHYKNW